MDLIDGLRAFVATAETGSFTAAADRMGISNRLTSKYVAELEAQLGARLLQRTTRKVGLTAAGENLLARAPALLDEIDEMLGEVSEGSRGFTGVLRISAPVTFGEVYVQEMLARFAAPHPELVIDLRLNDARVDLASEGIDLAFRVGNLSVSSLRQRRLGTMGSVMVASPDYLAEHGVPEVPQDLAQHSCIADTNRAQPTRWPFQQGARVFHVDVPSRFLVNSARVARDQAIQGIGIAACPRFVLTQALSDGALVEVLADWRPDPLPVSAIYLEGRTLPRKVRALINFAHEDAKRVALR
ncbi:MAG: LysR substrate-binding domain-containing protein [Thalassovita sp.]